MNPHWIELGAVILGLIKIILQLGRMLEKFDALVGTVAEHKQRIWAIEQRLGRQRAIAPNVIGAKLT